MSKNLQILQTIAKIAKIVCKVLFICCIVGAALCLLGIVMLAASAGTGEITSLGGMTIYGLIAAEAGVSIGTMYAGMVATLISAVGAAILFRLSELYFKRELEDGTPFTAEGGKALFKLGIECIVISLASVILASIAQGVIEVCMADVVRSEIVGGSGVEVGAFFLLLSVFCKYGAELREEK